MPSLSVIAETWGTFTTPESVFTSPTFACAENDSICVIFNCGEGATINSIETNDGEVLSSVFTPILNASDTTQVNCYLITKCKANAAKTVTITFAIGQEFIGAMLLDVNALLTFDSKASDTQNPSSTLTPVITTSAAPDLAFGFAARSNSSDQATWPSGFEANAETAFPTGGFCNGAWDTFATTETSLSIPITWSASVLGIAVVAAFTTSAVPAGGGGVKIAIAHTLNTGSAAIDTGRTSRIAKMYTPD